MFEHAGRHGEVEDRALDGACLLVDEHGNVLREPDFWRVDELLGREEHFYSSRNVEEANDSGLCGEFWVLTDEVVVQLELHHDHHELLIGKPIEFFDLLEWDEDDALLRGFGELLFDTTSYLLADDIQEHRYFFEIRKWKRVHELPFGLCIAADVVVSRGNS